MAMMVGVTNSDQCPINADFEDAKRTILGSNYNSIEDVQFLFGKMHTICSAVVKDPQNEKIRKLRCKNKIVQQLTLVPGASMLFKSLNFTRILEDNISYFVYSSKDIKVLENYVKWYETYAKAILFEPGYSIVPPIKIKTKKTGKTIKAIFYKHETLADIHSFLERVTSEKEFYLATVVPKTDYNLKSDLKKTIEQENLIGGNMIIKSSNQEAGIVMDMTEQHRILEEDMRRQHTQEKNRLIQQQKQAELAARAKERENALLAFKEDRSDLKEKIQRKRMTVNKSQKVLEKPSLLEDNDE